MPTRGLSGSFRECAVLGCVLLLGSACRSYPGGPVLPKTDTSAVNVGYGTQDKRDANGSVAKASGEKLMESSPRTVSDMLVGRFAGVEVYQTANGGTSIRIRGARSINGNEEPLFVLDGYPQHNGSASLADLDPHDIKSIEVLKGADASVYGSRGANGVILISTKKAQ